MEVLSVQHVSKTYPGVTALQDVSFSLRAGEIRAVCGENGAGKSTLVKILMGIVAPDSGSIAVDGRVQAIRGPQQAEPRSRARGAGAEPRAASVDPRQHLAGQRR